VVQREERDELQTIQQLVAAADAAGAEQELVMVVEGQQLRIDELESELQVRVSS
jgi:hypothetical protein